jgi:hypothetical protein
MCRLSGDLRSRVPASMEHHRDLLARVAGGGSRRRILCSGISDLSSSQGQLQQLQISLPLMPRGGVLRVSFEGVLGVLRELQGVSYLIA